MGSRFDESKHPRGGKGSAKGGQFVSKGGSSDASSKPKTIKQIEIAPKKKINGLIAHVPTDDVERRAIYSFTQRDAKAINQMLRDGDKPESMGYGDTVSQMDKIIASHKTTEELTVTRFVHKKFADQLRNSNSITDPGYISTSANPSDMTIDSSLEKMTIVIPKGTNAALLDEGSAFPNQAEVVLGRGTTLEKTGDLTFVVKSSSSSSSQQTQQKIAVGELVPSPPQKKTAKSSTAAAKASVATEELAADDLLMSDDDRKEFDIEKHMGDLSMDDQALIWDAMANWVKPSLSDAGSPREKLNTALRKGETVPDQKLLDGMDKAFSVAPVLKKETVLFRGIMGGLSLKEGDTFTDKGFASTSNDPVHAGDYALIDDEEAGGKLMYITVPKGTKVVVPEDKSANFEPELILNRGTKYKVTRVLGQNVYVQVVK